MLQSRDVDSLAGAGKITIDVSMILFVILVIIMWTLMGFQLHRQRRQDHAETSDLEIGHAVAVPEASISLIDLISTAYWSRRASKSSWSTSEPSSSTAPSSKSGVPWDSQWYREERPVRYFFHKMRNALGKQKSERVQS
ncbi:hypothetical protein F5Y09DRAFT_344439 [Xylaria sp. FL1042]|nr:hypothetical protein F5Y09DRAFT_344439 [Xylaria sp. FL1042]